MQDPLFGLVLFILLLISSASVSLDTIMCIITYVAIIVCVSSVFTLIA